MDFTEADWLEEMSRAHFGGDPYDEAIDRTIQDMMRLRGIGYKTAHDWLEREVRAGKLTRRDIIVNGKRTAVYRKLLIDGPG